MVLSLKNYYNFDEGRWQDIMNNNHGRQPNHVRVSAAQPIVNKDDSGNLILSKL